MATIAKKEQKTLSKASKEYQRILGHVLDQEPGAMMTYRDVEFATGVKMDRAGRNKLRRAILRSKKEYSAVPNVGYQLAQANMVTGILTFRLQRIDNQVKRADRAHKVLQDQFFNELGEQEQRVVLFCGSIFGAIRQAAENGQRLYTKSNNLIANSSEIPVPDVS